MAKHQTERKVHRADIHQLRDRDDYGAFTAAFGMVQIFGTTAVRERSDIYMFGQRTQVNKSIEILGWGAKHLKQGGILSVSVIPLPASNQEVRLRFARQFGVEMDQVVIL